MSKPSLLRQRRKDKKWSQTELAEALGVTKSYVSKIERHGCNGLDRVKQIQAIFPDLTIEQISTAAKEKE